MSDSKRRDGELERVTVIGLGRFGSSMVRNLYEIGYDVIAIDISQDRVDDVQRDALLAVRADGTDEESLIDLDVDQSDVAIGYAYGEAVEFMTGLGIDRVCVFNGRERSTEPLG